MTSPELLCFLMFQKTGLHICATPFFWKCMEILEWLMRMSRGSGSRERETSAGENWEGLRRACKRTGEGLKQEPAREGVCCHDSAPRRPVLIRRVLCFAIGHESEGEADGASRREEPLGPEVWVSGGVLSDEGPVHGERAWPTGGEEGGEETEGSVGGTADRDPALGKLLRSHQELCGLAG